MLKMPEEIAEDNLIFKPDSKTRQFYGFMGIVEANTEFLAELELDCERQGVD